MDRNLKEALLINSNFFDDKSAFSSDDGDEKWNEFNRLLKTHLYIIGFDLSDWYDENDNYEIIICVRIDLNFTMIYNLSHRHPNSRLIYIASEEESVCPFHNKTFLKYLPFDIIYTWQSEATDNHGLFKHYFYPHSSQITQLENFNKKFICTVTSLKSGYGVFMNQEYLKRRNLIYKFSQLGGHIFGHGWSPKLKNYKGIVLNKFHKMQNYTYALVLENSFNEDNAISEKIFHAMKAGAIPVYLGAPNIDKILPKYSFVDLREFNSLSNCINYLDKNPDIIERSRKVISHFLKSTTYEFHTSEYWAKQIVDDIEDITETKYRTWPMWKLMLVAFLLTKGTFLLTKFFRSMLRAFLK
jgi:hypothetical protein